MVNVPLGLERKQDAGRNLPASAKEEVQALPVPGPKTSMIQYEPRSEAGSRTTAAQLPVAVEPKQIAKKRLAEGARHAQAKSACSQDHPAVQLKLGRGSAGRTTAAQLSSAMITEQSAKKQPAEGAVKQAKPATSQKITPVQLDGDSGSRSRTTAAQIPSASQPKEVVKKQPAGSAVKDVQAKQASSQEPNIVQLDLGAKQISNTSTASRTTELPLAPASKPVVKKQSTKVVLKPAAQAKAAGPMETTVLQLNLENASLGNITVAPEHAVVEVVEQRRDSRTEADESSVKPGTDSTKMVKTVKTVLEISIPAQQTQPEAVNPASSQDLRAEPALAESKSAVAKGKSVAPKVQPAVVKSKSAVAERKATGTVAETALVGGEAPKKKPGRPKGSKSKKAAQSTDSPLSKDKQSEEKLPKTRKSRVAKPKVLPASKKASAVNEKA